MTTTITQLGGVYALTFEGTRKFYVGSTKSFQARKTCHMSHLRHKRHKNERLVAIVEERGLGCVQFVPIAVLSGDYIRKTEHRILKTLFGHPDCLNKSATAIGWPVGYVLSEEKRKLLSERNKGRVVSLETRKLLSEANKRFVASGGVKKGNRRRGAERHVVSDATRQKLRDAQNARYAQSLAETGTKMQPRSDGWRAKHSALRKGVPWTDARRAAEAKRKERS